VFLTVFLIVLSAGYTAGLVFVDHTTSSSPGGITEEFAGNEQSTSSTGDLKYAKSDREMYTLIHNHILSLAMVFFALGGIFYFSSIVSKRMKLFLLVEPLLAVVTTFGGIALVRSVHPAFSWLVMISGISMVLCFATMTGLILYELWRTPGR
jgi:hypothetical protein